MVRKKKNGSKDVRKRVSQECTKGTGVSVSVSKGQSKQGNDITIIVIALSVVIGVCLFAINLDSFFPPVHTDIDEIQSRFKSDANFTSAGRGSAPDAEVNLIAYMDYYCPYCREEYVVLKKVMVEYPAQVNVVVKHYPAHPGSLEAAYAAECARDQDAFWSYSDLIFSQRYGSSREDLMDMARKIALNMTQFTYCFDNNVKEGVIYNDKIEARDAQIQGTPTLFVNDVELRGAKSFSIVQTQVEYELQK